MDFLFFISIISFNIGMMVFIFYHIIKIKTFIKPIGIHNPGNKFGELTQVS
jgi:hypothetical protein